MKKEGEFKLSQELIELLIRECIESSQVAKSLVCIAAVAAKANGITDDLWIEIAEECWNASHVAVYKDAAAVEDMSH